MLYTMSFTKHSRFSAVQRSRVPVMAHVICCCEEDSLISSISRDTLSTNKTHEKENFDDLYIIMEIVQ